MKKARKETTLAVRLDVAIGPGGRGTIICREQRILCGMLADHLGQIAAGNAAVVTCCDLDLVRFLVFCVALQVLIAE